MTSKSLVVVAPTARLVVYDHGGDGEPLVLLHGGPGCPDYLAPLADLLPNKYRVIRFDQRGVGQSVAFDRRYGIEDYLSDLTAIRTYFGFERLHLFGHAWGGLLAQLYARQQPERVRSLFLCNSAIGVGTDWKRLERAVVSRTQQASGWAGSASLAAWFLVLKLPGQLGKLGAKRAYALAWRSSFENPRIAFPPDPQWLNGVSGEALERTSRALTAAKPTVMQTVADAPTWPVLILYGRQGYDLFGSEVHTVYGRFPAARRVVLQNSGHLPWIQDREAFQKVLASFYD